MKKTLNILGIIFLVMFFTGILFKRLHYPGAGILITLGMFLFVTIYITGFLISLSKLNGSGASVKNRILLILGFPANLLLSFGILAKIQHWPGASIGLWSGIGLFSLLFLIFLLVGKKEDQRISMISVLIVVVLLGSFSFNTFRIGHFRPMTDAYSLNRTSFSESSKVFWKSCESRINLLSKNDSSLLETSVRNELLNLHSKVQETDLILGQMIEKISIAENEAVSLAKESQKYEFMTQKVNSIFNSNEGINLLDQKMTELQNLINGLSKLEAVKKQALIGELQYPFNYEGAELVYKFTGMQDYNSEVTMCTLLLWKSKIWQIEYQLINDITKS